MGISRLLALAVLLASASSSPIAPDAPDRDPISPSDGSPMIPSANTASGTRITRRTRGPPTWDSRSTLDTRPPPPFSPVGPIRPGPLPGPPPGPPPGSLPGSPPGPPPGPPPAVLPGPPPMEQGRPPRPQDPGNWPPGKSPLDTCGNPIIPLYQPIQAAGNNPENADDIYSDPSLAAEGGVIAGACVHTTSIAVASPCAWNGVMTVYPSTTTATKELDCGGCAELEIQRAHYPCPNHPIDATEYATVPSTYWSTVCAASATSLPDSTRAKPSPQSIDAAAPIATTPPPQAAATPSRPFTTRMPIPTSLLRPHHTPISPITSQGHPPPTAALPTPAPVAARHANDTLEGRDPSVRFGKDGMLCPTTYYINPHMTAGRIWTHFNQMLTSTVCLPCMGCPLVTSTQVQGYGQHGRFKTSTTVPYGVTTVFKCLGQ